jgi:hypothetical protein
LHERGSPRDDRIGAASLGWRDNTLVQQPQQEVERLALHIDWDPARKTLRPPQLWFVDEEDNPH